MEYSIDKISQEINKLRDEAVLVERQIATDPYASIELDLIYSENKKQETIN